LQRLVKEIPESDWQDIEVVGWLYQFYISERKDEVIGAKSKVTAADIPAATQLFTPRWIVQYMVENSLGRLWLESHPESKLREKMPYYLEPLPNPLLQGEGTREENSCSPPLAGEGLGERFLTPQELTVIDPACGSGHILVYAFDLLFEIYKEQGYLERDIPALILTHNLHGLDIDERAAQLASFGVLMKARAKNSRILRKPVVLNITTI
jgi:type II restriction/modification system DNA methylase subunit YeeA